MRLRIWILLIILIIVFFAIKCFDGITANLFESVFMLLVFSLLILKLMPFKDIAGAWMWAKKHRYFGVVLIFSYVTMLLQLIIHFYNERLRFVDVVTLEIQAILFFTACISLGFWAKEKISLIFK